MCPKARHSPQTATRKCSKASKQSLRCCCVAVAAAVTAAAVAAAVTAAAVTAAATAAAVAAAAAVTPAAELLRLLLLPLFLLLLLLLLLLFGTQLSTPCMSVTHLLYLSEEQAADMAQWPWTCCSLDQLFAILLTTSPVGVLWAT